MNKLKKYKRSNLARQIASKRIAMMEAKRNKANIGLRNVAR